MSKPAGKDCPPRPGEASEAGIYLGPHRKPFVRCAHPKWRRSDSVTAVASTQAKTKDRAPEGEATSEDGDVRLTGVSKHYGEVVAVESLELEVRRGEFFTMLGPSGSGKTTTLRMIAGFEEPDTGTIELAGRDVNGEPP